MAQIVVLWDLAEEPQGNIQHIAEHGITQDEYEEVLDQHHNEAQVSRSSGESIAFGWTSTGKHIAIVWEHVDDDPLTIRPITAYETDPPRSRKGKKRRGH
jgi:hypothetical protein